MEEETVYYRFPKRQDWCCSCIPSLAFEAVTLGKSLELLQPPSVVRWEWWSKPNSRLGLWTWSDFSPIRPFIVQPGAQLGCNTSSSSFIDRLFHWVSLTTGQIILSDNSRHLISTCYVPVFTHMSLNHPSSLKNRNHYFTNEETNAFNVPREKR